MIDTVIHSNSIAETKQLAQKVASQLTGGEVICLIGDLGAGKTYFTKFLAEALGVNIDDVISPTFVYWRQHSGKKFTVHHFDFYRLDASATQEQLSDELGNIGIEEAFADQDAVTLIEWADRISGFLPEERLEIHITNEGEQERKFTFKMFGEKNQNLDVSEQK